MPINSRRSPASSVSSSRRSRSRSAFSRIGLRVHGDVFAGRHRHRACHDARNARREHGSVARFGGRDADEQARRRHDAVVRAEHGSTQPADARRAVSFEVSHDHRGQCTVSRRP
jgi:hypothetical protein